MFEIFQLPECISSRVDVMKVDEWFQIWNIEELQQNMTF